MLLSVVPENSVKSYFICRFMTVTHFGQFGMRTDWVNGARCRSDQLGVSVCGCGIECLQCSNKCKFAYRIKLDARMQTRIHVYLWCSGIPFQFSFWYMYFLRAACAMCEKCKTFASPNEIHFNGNSAQDLRWFMPYRRYASFHVSDW